MTRLPAMTRPSTPSYSPPGTTVSSVASARPLLGTITSGIGCFSPHGGYLLLPFLFFSRAAIAYALLWLATRWLLCVAPLSGVTPLSGGALLSARGGLFFVGPLPCLATACILVFGFFFAFYVYQVIGDSLLALGLIGGTPAELAFRPASAALSIALIFGFFGCHLFARRASSGIELRIGAAGALGGAPVLALLLLAS